MLGHKDVRGSGHDQWRICGEGGEAYASGPLACRDRFKAVEKPQRSVHIVTYFCKIFKSKKL